MSRKISRRNFLTIAATLSAAGALSATARAQSPFDELFSLLFGENSGKKLAESASSAQEVQESSAISAAAVPADKTLVVYFSHSSAGNTRSMAQRIARAAGGDLLELQAANAYLPGYLDSDRAQRERDENARPAIANLPENIDQYGIIIVGYPIWWHTAPMIIGTFLESFDLTGKDVYVFAQSASMDTEQFANSMEFVRKCAEGAAVHDGLFARPSDAEAIDTYLSRNGLA